MSEVTVTRNPEALTMAMEVTYEVPIERVWDIWENPRKLERWWGPPGWPATFEEFNFVEGGTVSYYMTGPDGDRPRGWWKFRKIDRPRYLEITDGFADENGNPDDGMPVGTFTVDLDETDGGTRMRVVSAFGSLEDMEKLIEMGMEEGMKLAMGQIDALL